MAEYIKCKSNETDRGFHKHKQIWQYWDAETYIRENTREQDSPPAWTQEAYRPLCSKSLGEGTYLGVP